MKLNELILDYCRKNGLSQRQFSEKIGISSGYLTMLIRNQNYNTKRTIQPTIDTYKKVAVGMGLSIDELFEAIDDAPISIPPRGDVEFFSMGDLNRHSIPIIGSVAGGEPIYDEDFDLYIDGPVNATCAVRLRGDSMEPTYIDGDLIYVKEQPNVNDGQVAIVFLDSEAVLKRVYHVKDGLQLLSDNPKYKPISATGDEYESIRILGVPCGYTRMYN